jgi:hypothetical protein
VLLRLPGSPMPLLELVPIPLLLGKPLGFGLSLLRVPVPGVAVVFGFAPIEPPRAPAPPLPAPPPVPPPAPPPWANAAADIANVRTVANTIFFMVVFFLIVAFRWGNAAKFEMFPEPQNVAIGGLTMTDKIAACVIPWEALWGVATDFTNGKRLAYEVGTA